MIRSEASALRLVERLSERDLLWLASIAAIRRGTSLCAVLQGQQDPRTAIARQGVIGALSAALPFASPEELAALIGCSRRTVADALRKGRAA